MDFFGVTAEGNFEGSTILRRPVGAAAARGRRPVEAGRRRSWPRRRRRGSGPASTTRSSPSGTPCTPRPWPRRRPAPAIPDGRDAAVAIGEFLFAHLRRPEDGRWLRSWQPDGGARHLAYAGDYAWLVDCFTRLGELTGEARLDRPGRRRRRRPASTCSTTRTGRGFFTTGHDAEPLIVRTKDVFDGATPSANAVAALALARLGALTGGERYTDARPPGGRPASATCSPDTRPPSPTPCSPPTSWPRGAPRSWSPGTAPTWWTWSAGRGWPGAVLAWGEPTGVAAVGRAGRGPGLRVPELRVPAAGRRRRHPASPSCRPARTRGDPVSRSSTRTPRSGTARDVARDIKPRDQIEVAGGTTLTAAGALLPRRGHHRRGPGVGDAGAGAGGLARGPRPRPRPLRRGRGPAGRGARARRPGPARGGDRQRAPPPSRDPPRPPGAAAPPPAGRTGRGARARVPGGLGPVLGVPRASAPRWP